MFVKAQLASELKELLSMSFKTLSKNNKLYLAQNSQLCPQPIVLFSGLGLDICIFK